MDNVFEVARAIEILTNVWSRLDHAEMTDQAESVMEAIERLTAELT